MSSSRIRRSVSRDLILTLTCAAGLVLALPAHDRALGEPGAKDAGAPAATERPAAAPAGKKRLAVEKGEATGAKGATKTAAPEVGKALERLPMWTAPEQYSVDMVVTRGKESFVLKRSIAGARVRSDFDVQGQQMSIVELGDKANTTYSILPEQKKAMKQSRQALADLDAKAAPKEEGKEAAAPAGSFVYLGRESVNGKEADKYEFKGEDQVAYAWIDPATQFPVRMMASGATVDWKNYHVAPQPDENFAPPKDYEVVDVDAMMAKMKGAAPGGYPVPSAAGMSAMAGAMAGGATGGPPGGMPAGLGQVANHMAGSMGGQFGSGLGNALGSKLGTALGGPLGGMVGNYVGGRVGQMIGQKAAEALTPGK